MAAVGLLLLMLYLIFVVFRKISRLQRAWNRFWGVSRSRSSKRFRSYDPFYDSAEWDQMRRLVLRTYGPICMKCGVRNTVMQVDHIQPRSKYPKLALQFENLQVLCRPCNMRKSNHHSKDYRGKRRQIARRFGGASAAVSRKG